MKRKINSLRDYFLTLAKLPTPTDIRKLRTVILRKNQEIIQTRQKCSQTCDTFVEMKKVRELQGKGNYAYECPNEECQSHCLLADYLPVWNESQL